MPQAILQTWHLTLTSWIYLAMHLPQVIGHASCILDAWPITWASTLDMYHAAISVYLLQVRLMSQHLPGSLIMTQSLDEPQRGILP